MFECGVRNLHPELVKMLGRLHYRTSYGQNVLQHSIEVSHIAGMMAPSWVRMSRLPSGPACSTTWARPWTTSWRHPRVPGCGVRPEVQGAGGHHPRHRGPPQRCGAPDRGGLSGAGGRRYLRSRPGARRENLENYIKRLEQLETITGSYPGVDKAYAIQAGREVRVMVRPEQVSEDQMVILARDLAKKIEEEMEYPGQIKVHVLRETKVIEYAK